MDVPQAVKPLRRLPREPGASFCARLDADITLAVGDPFWPLII
jgi:hypothetical protein